MRSSPGVHRVAAILNFFASHTGQAFTLTELVTSLKISRATCHTLLTGLVEVGYLHRLSGKSYVVGPVLVSLAHSVSAHHSPLQIAQPEMRALADAFDGICLAAFREGDEVAVRERAASAANPGWSVPPGSRLPLRPPFGAIFFAHTPKSEADAWLAKAEPKPTPEQRAQIFEAMLFAREYGFCFGEYPDEQKRRRANSDWLVRGEMDDPPVRLATQLDPQRTYKLAFVSAPVFELHQDAAAFELVLTGLKGEFTGEAVARIGQRVREACERIGGFVSAPPVAAA